MFPSTIDGRKIQRPEAGPYSERRGELETFSTKWNVSFKSLPSEKSGGGKNVRATGDGGLQENKMLANQLRKARMNPQKLKHRAYMVLCVSIIASGLVFFETSESVNGCVSDSALYWASYLLLVLPCPTLM